MKNNKALVIVFVLLFILAVLAVAVIIQKQYFSSGKDNVSLLYVVHGETSVQNNSLSIAPEHIHWFTDKPVRKAGKMSADNLVDLWNKDFKASPPNAAITGSDVNAVVEIDQATFNNGKINFEYGVIYGELPNGDLGTASVFIDLATGNDVGQQIYIHRNAIH